MKDKFAGYDALVTEDLIGKVVVNQEDEYVMDDWVVDVMKELGVLEKSTRKECVARTGKSPITTRRIDTNKGTEENSKSRLAARDFKKNGGKEKYELLFLDEKKSHLKGKVDDEWGSWCCRWKQEVELRG